MSTSTASSRGGITFERLCSEGEAAYYVCHEECTVHDISNEDSLQEVEDKLVNKIEENFRAIEIGRTKTIKTFYIGKTYVRKPKNKNAVIPTDPETWKRRGIGDRWRYHKNEDYGKDGMIVIAVITKDQVPLHQNGNRVMNKEEYTLQLEKRLLGYYENDTRLANKTPISGGKDKMNSAGYALYFAFSLEPKANEDNSLEGNEDNSLEGNEDNSLEGNEDNSVPEMLSNLSLNPHDTPKNDDNTTITDEPIVRSKPKLVARDQTKLAKGKEHEGIEVDTSRQWRSVKDENHLQTLHSPCKSKRQYTCSYCKEQGHNIRTCKKKKLT